MYKEPPIRIGVVGTGVMGGHHTRVASHLSGCNLVGIYDTDITRAESLAAQFDTQAFTMLQSLCHSCEAVIVATPTVTHADIAAQCLEAGCHVLLEKPIAHTVAAGEKLLETRDRTGRTLMVGHVERFNPAVQAIRGLLSPEEIFACDLQRLSPSAGRDQSADIILDLMIHDIDLAFAFSGSKVREISALGHNIRGELIDHVNAMLLFENGTTITLAASAVSQERVRKARIFTRETQLTADLANREVWLHRQGQSRITRDEGQYIVTSQLEQILVPNKEPLALEQEHFIQIIRTGATPETTGESALEALKLAFAIQSAVRASQTCCCEMSQSSS